MKYDHISTGTFISRPNRFIAKVQIGQEIVTVHVKNTGRCKEILVPGAKVVLSASDSPNRKTPYDLVAAYKGDLLINIDSQAPNAAFRDYIASSGCFGPHPQIYPEKVHGDSRFDFYVESGDRRIFAEVKGVTLEKDGICMFPDAPTERSLKHIRGLEESVKEGYEVYLVMIVQMKGMKGFVPNYSMHREFGEAMEHAERSGGGRHGPGVRRYRGLHDGERTPDPHRISDRWQPSAFLMRSWATSGGQAASTLVTVHSDRYCLKNSFLIASRLSSDKLTIVDY
jgi:sugar fermentation stimulation protein A